MKLKIGIIVVLMGLVGALGLSKTETSKAEGGHSETLTLYGRDFTNGHHQGFITTETGLTMAAEAVTAVYTSEVMAAPIPFNALVPEQNVNVPEGTSLEISVRTQKENGPWSDWHEVEVHPDWNEDQTEEIQAGDMIVVPAADTTHDFIQIEVNASRYADSQMPTLEQLNLVFIDTTDGPTTADLIERQRELDAAKEPGFPTATDDYPRPFVISRAAWCTEPECWYSNDLRYEPVTHLLMHHTVTSSTGDLAATVRAIWHYHTFTREWGDIGYNYLIGQDGSIFEGHLNENYEQWDVVGTHAAAANAGGFGVSLIGNFTSPDEGSGIEPSSAMMESMANLFAWKADQRNIDPYGASRMVEMNWGLPHIMGHRDVYGGLNTLCPGGRAYNRLPWLRDAVASRIGFVSPYIFVDETSSAFSKSNANWYEGPRGCGNNNHSYYTWSTTDPGESTNWADWTLNVPSDGRYRIEIYAPYCNTGEPETAGAYYTVHHALGSSNVIINQDAHVGLWMTLGEFNLTAGSGNSLHLTDLTTTDNGRGVWFDAVRLLYLGDPIAFAENRTPGNDIWLTNRTVDFDWDIFSTSPVLETRLQVATDPNMTNLIVDQPWSGSVLQHSHTFGQDYYQLYWRVKAVIQHMNNTTETIISDPSFFRLDATAPTSIVKGVYQVPNQPGYGVYWSGLDDTSGISGYTIQYRPQGMATWTNWLENTTLTSERFNPPDGQVYEFRSQAVDVAGNVETAHTSPDVDTSQSILLDRAIMLPVTLR